MQRSKRAVVPIRALGDAEALAWLASKAPVANSNTELARAWGWNPTKVSRRLKTWAADGKVARSNGSLTVVTPTAAAGAANVGQNVVVPAKAAAGEAPFGVRLVRAVLVATALALGVIGLILNARFAAAFGQTVEAAWMLAAVGLAIDVLALVLPVAAGELFRRRRYVPAVGAWSVWVLALGMTLMAASGFASTQIGDAVAGRSRTADQATGFTERLHRLRDERSQLRETRAVATIDAELQAAQGAVGALWRPTSGCTDVTRAESARACEPVQRLRQSRGEAVRRDGIDSQIIDLEHQVAAMPPVTVSDPGATMATELVTWLSAGTVGITERDVQRARVLGLTTMPPLAGLLLGFAMLMYGRP